MRRVRNGEYDIWTPPFPARGYSPWLRIMFEPCDISHSTVEIYTLGCAEISQLMGGVHNVRQTVFTLIEPKDLPIILRLSDFPHDFDFRVMMGAVGGALRLRWLP